MRIKSVRPVLAVAVMAALIILWPAAAGAQDSALTATDVQATLDNIWVFVAGCMVFLMQAGFALVEAGLTRAKNVVNIMAKNMSDMIVGVAVFWLIGYGLAFGAGNDLFGTSSFMLWGQDLLAIGGSGVGNLTVSTFFFFQVVFAATAVTIVSGAMAERTKFVGYLTFSVVMCALIYPVVVHWTWGGGLIANLSIGDAVYSDFAGSTIVHMTGGIAALVGAKMVGAREGKYASDGSPRAIPGHNIPFAIIGVFILWFGWFGFNPGSELAADTAVMFVGMNTLLASIAGGAATTAVVWAKTGKPDIAMIGNGVLAGLVSITAGCGTVTPVGALIVGAIAGLIVVFSVFFFDRHGIDDPVGAVSVHGVCGIWGTLTIGLFARYDDAFLGRENAGLFYGGGLDQLLMQALFVIIVAAWVGVMTTIAFTLIKRTVGLRVHPSEESEGLDLPEHGLAAYSSDTVAV